MTDPTSPTRPAPLSPAVPAGHWRFIHSVFFVSGLISLVYQVLWMRQLGLLFGNTAHAAATTLAAFFLGLAVGGWIGGRVAPGLRSPLRAYGWLEIGIALGAALYFGLMQLYAGLYPPLFRSLGHQSAVFTLLKFALGVLVLLPASAMIGATLPVVGQHLLRRPEMLGRGGTVLYAVNTLGAAVGAYVAAFVLPLLLGFRATYVSAIAANLVLGVLVLVAARSAYASLPAGATAGGAAAAPPPVATAGTTSWTRIRWLAFASGLVTLALEVLWTHMFAQVLHNSVYTFAIILIAFLLALAGGSWLAHWLIREERPVVPTLTTLLVAGSALVALSPWTFYAVTGGMRYVGESLGWGSYQALVFTLAALIVMPPTLLLGTVFPYLLKLAESHSKSAGRTLGELVAINTAAAIAGSLLAGFGLLAWIGLWPSIRFVALLGLAAVPIAAARALRPMTALGWSVAGASLLLMTIFPVAQPPRLNLDADRNERVRQVWQGSSGVIAVVDHGDGLIIKVNNHYTLGGSGEQDEERRQGMLPLLLHPDPKEVFYLGMGTGITASAAMTTRVEKVTICELVGEVIAAARAHFGPWTGGLFTDPRTRIVPEDGRTFLAMTDERYDVIVSDLFIPWEARAGSLYSLEHYRAARERLKPGGIFAQWIPLYQMSRREFLTVARTMMEVFPHITVWRGDWKISTPALALVGRLDDRPLDPAVTAARIAETPEPVLLGAGSGAHDNGLDRLLWGYSGNLTAARSLLAGAPLNTDDRPRIEYLAPVTHRQVGSGHGSFLTGEEMIRLLQDLATAAPPEGDPYLSRLPPPTRRYAAAGLLLQRSSLHLDAGRMEEADSVDTALGDLMLQIVEERERAGR